MSVNRIEAKRFMNKSEPDGDFSCNPYYGCSHHCVYCYAKYIMQGPVTSKNWDNEILVKEFSDYSIPRGTGSANLFLSTATDSYQPIELKEKVTRKILEAIVDSDLHVSILTKSKHVVRDIDLFKRMKNVSVSFSIALDDDLSAVFEPGASRPSERIEALKILHKENIRTGVLVAPVLPYLTDVFSIIEKIRGHTDSVMFDTLNFKSPEHIRNVMFFIATRFPEHYENYRKIFIQKDKTYYRQLKTEILACEKKTPFGLLHIYK